MSRTLVEKDFPIITSPQGERAYAYRYLRRFRGQTSVVEKYSTNFPAVVRVVEELRQKGIKVITYSVFV